MEQGVFCPGYRQDCLKVSFSDRSFFRYWGRTPGDLSVCCGPKKLPLHMERRQWIFIRHFSGRGVSGLSFSVLLCCVFVGRSDIFSSWGLSPVKP